MTSQTAPATARLPATCPDMPEESIRVIAEGLTKRGLTVRTAGCEDGQLLKVTGTGKAACEVVAAEDYYFNCEYTASRSRRTGPADVARVVARMLSADYTSPQRYAHLHQGTTPAGAVGREMRARGMAVTLSIAEDEESCTVYAGVVVTNPAKPERGKVHHRRQLGLLGMLRRRNGRPGRASPHRRRCPYTRPARHHP
jgi:hypothetical protein